jgi:uncharacterized C2H2 Zn-finger protein
MTHSRALSCPVCGDTFQELKNLKLHMNPAHGWSLNDTRKDHLKQRFEELDGRYINLVTWIHAADEKQVITGRLERGKLTNKLYNGRGEWMVQWLGGHGPVGGFWIHEPNPESDRLGLPTPSRRVIEAEPLYRIKVEIGDDACIKEL